MRIKPYFSLHDLRGRMVLVICALSLISLGLLVVDRIHLANRILYEREQYRINVIGELLSGHIADCLENNDPGAALDAVQHATRQRDVRVVSVLDLSGKIVISSQPPVYHPHHDTPSITSRDSLLVRSFPFSVNGQPQGFVQIGLSLQDLHRDRQNMISSALIMVLIMAAAILTAALLTATYLMRPLQLMKNAADRIAAGDFSVRVPVRSEDTIGQLAGAIDAMAGHLQDLTNGLQKRIDDATADLRQKSQELQDSNIKLLELDRLKSDFVSMVSHELRTPLTSIIGFARTLQRMDLPADQRMRYLGVIESEGRRLANLVREYLDITRIESGRLDLSLKPTHWFDIVHDALSSIDENLRYRINIDIPADTPLILADISHLRRAVLNLIDNALKYSPAAEMVFITVDCHPASVIFSVCDHGPGIAAAETSKVFDKFYRGADYAVRCISGSGLGLSIVRGIVEAHHGRVWFISSPQNGTTFFIDIPTISRQVRAIDATPHSLREIL